MDNTETNEQFAQRMRTRRGDAPAPARKEPILGHYRIGRGLGPDPHIVLVWLIDERGASIADPTDDFVLTLDRFRETAREGNTGYTVSLYDHEVPAAWWPHKLR